MALGSMQIGGGSSKEVEMGSRLQQFSETSAAAHTPGNPDQGYQIGK